MEIRNRDNVNVITEHETVKVYQLSPKWELAELTKGTYMEFIDDFEIEAGAVGQAHYHDTHEWYYMLEGNAVVQIEQEAKKITVGDLVYIPPNAKHFIYPVGDKKMRALCWAASYQPVGGVGYFDTVLSPVDPT